MSEDPPGPLQRIFSSCRGSHLCLCDCNRAVLDELRLRWESKLQKSGVLDPEPAPTL
jgi:hypothetical protein